MTVADVLLSDSALALVGTALGGAWTVFKSLDCFRRAQTRRYGKALETLEAGVEHTYRTYVEAIKSAREDGKLTREERREARRRAREAALRFGQANGIDVLAEIGDEYLDLRIAKLVKRLKAD